MTDYKEECLKNRKWHKENGDNALKWYNLLSIVSVILTGLQGLSMTIMGTLETDDISISIVGGSFAFILMVFSRVQSSFNFNVVSVHHNNLSDDFAELYELFSVENISPEVYNQHIHRYISVTEKSHLQPVPKCWLLECCCC